MGLWLVRAGQHGEQEEGALQHNVVTVGWNDMPDLSSAKSKAELASLYEKAYPPGKKMKAVNEVTQLWTFVDRIQPGDLVVLPLKLRAAIAIGKVSGPYEHRTDLSPNIHHVRPVEWIRTDLPRTAFEQDLLYSLGAYMTVCRIQRNNAEERVRAILAGNPLAAPEGDEAEESQAREVDVEQVARDQIVEYLNRRFRGHDMARLVDAVLQAQGYLTRRSEPGPDGGVDILAGKGPMGFDEPRLCVQVKSSQSPADVTVLRNLQGTQANFKAAQGLLVSWGGFNRAVLEEARRSFFTVRLWDSGDLLEALLRNYDSFPDELKAELPLKRIWGLVIEQEADLEQE
jgi:restriction system protein